MSWLRRSAPIAALLAAVLALSACAGGGSSEPAADTTGGAGFPVTIEHVHGKTEIPAKPKRIVTIGWMTEDIVAALGTAPVGVPSAWGGDKDGFTPWFRKQVTEVLKADLPTVLKEGEDPDFEQILSLQPDLILAPHSGVTETQYQRLSEIAPTVAYAERPWTSGSWEELTRTVATALGEKALGEKLIAQTEDRIDAAVQAHPKLRGTDFLYGLTLPEGSTELGLYISKDPRVAFLREFGLVDSPDLGKALGNIGSDDFYGAVSLEKLGEIKTDLFVGWSRSASETKATLANPVFSRWTPIADGRFYFIEDETMGMATNGPTVLSIPWAIDAGFVDELSKATQGGSVVRPAKP
ncbi:hypothetical protein BMH32_09660 [Leucobacter sp. OLJS4]|uniref:iron-siderophore ABC transporter substrate-binding protein n=1 Tax=unclassified Leucobacter TaxID=2621730 RepID=UPI000C17E914|nr:MULTISPECIES: iron-siderophore ABC transporter substrate-binding protein [unclassified Leucobacter]PIJ49341.1 hypothetical protein BMH30_04585 [Leucobacter sp. OLES1]PII83831.1 hypothetical protein BMH25_06945 [Leucobacter sp. OLCALW19]PII89364.1 hypothetical protein BMH26_03985 [Leucobacter sp. OLTLW20]PII90639.1 hypothetical protein BMH27_09775 [Leucobacter sp. OLAS13]PII98342.1 hypothetical protein BMH28_12855 [Leucobacter sp. OLCS4]